MVAFDCCNGTREKVEPVDENMPIYDALAKKYLNINCSVMSPNNSRMQYIDEMIDEYQVRRRHRNYPSGLSYLQYRIPLCETDCNK